MAERRSFSNKITGSDAFAELSFEAQALYFQLSMAADDEGFVSAPKKVQRGIGASINALDELEENGYLVFFDTGACVIAHWNSNNHINEKRKKATAHAEELSLIWLDDNGVYHMYEDAEEVEPVEVAEIEAKTEAEAEKDPCMQTACKLHAKPLPPSFLPLLPPSLPSPAPLSITPPIIPLIIPPHPFRRHLTFCSKRARKRLPSNTGAASSANMKKPRFLRPRWTFCA